MLHPFWPSASALPWTDTLQGPWCSLNFMEALETEWTLGSCGAIPSRDTASLVVLQGSFKGHTLSLSRDLASFEPQLVFKELLYSCPPWSNLSAQVCKDVASTEGGSLEAGGWQPPVSDLGAPPRGQIEKYISRQILHPYPQPHP